MKLPLLQFLRSFRASYWFVPSVMLALAIGAAALMVWLDAGPLAGFLDEINWYQKSKPEGAREVLSTIAGSMITVAGVVFSITIVAISFAANQFGPRILTNFMSDRGNQVTLGTFVATFAYAVLVLRTIHSGEGDFVPQLAVLIALLLALCSIAVLIYFIHHVPESIHINTITAHIGRQLVSAIETEIPSCLADPPERSEADERDLSRKAESLFGVGARPAEIAADKSGYLQGVDNEALVSAAQSHGVAVQLERTPGHFVFKGQTVALASPAASVDEEFCRKVQGGWTLGSKRTPEQDPLFLVDELTEIAARALSSGVNDPHTANTCVDWLAAAAAKVAERRSPSRFRLDEQGALRLVVPTTDFRLHIERGFGQLRPYLAGDLNAAAHALSTYASLAEACRSAEHSNVLIEEVDALMGLAQATHHGASRERLVSESIAARLALTSCAPLPPA